MTIPSGEEICRQVSEECQGKTLLSFSRGKDSIAAYIAIRDKFEEVVPYHLFLVPGLEFVDESLAYYEKVMGRHIYNLPHPSLYLMFDELVFQSPGNAAVLTAAGLPTFDYVLMHNLVAEAEGLDPLKVFSATGVRAADSPARRVAMITHGPINRTKRVFYPVWDWNKARLIEELTKSGIKLPVDYDLFGRSFDGLDLRFLYQIKHQRPSDYKRILEWFPLAESEIFRYEMTRA